MGLVATHRGPTPQTTSRPQPTMARTADHRGPAAKTTSPPAPAPAANSQTHPSPATTAEADWCAPTVPTRVAVTTRDLPALLTPRHQKPRRAHRRRHPLPPLQRPPAAPPTQPTPTSTEGHVVTTTTTLDDDRCTSCGAGSSSCDVRLWLSGRSCCPSCTDPHTHPSAVDHDHDDHDDHDHDHVDYVDYVEETTT